MKSLERDLSRVNASVRRQTLLEEAARACQEKAPRVRGVSRGNGGNKPRLNVHLWVDKCGR